MLGHSRPRFQQRVLQAELTAVSALLCPHAARRNCRLRKASQSILAHPLRVGMENLFNEKRPESEEVKI